jgi:hypothetical protein
VTFDDGSPLDEGLVLCEMHDDDKIVQARGELRKDGSFSLGSVVPGDGIYPGRYRVLVRPRGLTEAELRRQGPTIDPKYTAYESSGLTLTIPGDDYLAITVRRPRSKSP